MTLWVPLCETIEGYDGVCVVLAWTTMTEFTVSACLHVISPTANRRPWRGQWPSAARCSCCSGSRAREKTKSGGKGEPAAQKMPATARAAHREIASSRGPLLPAIPPPGHSRLSSSLFIPWRISSANVFWFCNICFFSCSNWDNAQLSLLAHCSLIVYLFFCLYPYCCFHSLLN